MTAELTHDPFYEQFHYSQKQYCSGRDDKILAFCQQINFKLLHPLENKNDSFLLEPEKAEKIGF